MPLMVTSAVSVNLLMQHILQFLMRTICYRSLEEIEKETRRLLNRLEKKRQAALIEITKHFQLNYSSQQSLGNPEDFDNEFSPVKKRKTF